MTTTEVQARPLSSSYKRIATAIIMAGVLMSAADTTAVVLGLPVMIEDLHSDIATMVWVIMAYLLVMTVFGAQVGKLGDMYGRVRMYNLGFALFTAASVLCGFSTSGSELIAFRLLQGAGGALISSNSGAIIADTFERSERGRAYGVIGIGYSIGAILGILLGGALTTFLGWRYIFFINLPVGAIGTVLGYLTLNERSPRIRGRLDIVGMGLLGSGLLLVLYSLTAVAGPGFTLFYEELIALGAAAVVGFAMWERRFPQPLIPLSLLRQWTLSASLLAVFLQWVASFGVIFLMIMYLQGPRGLTPFGASLLYVPAYLLAGATSPLAGRLADRLGARVISSLGLALQAAGFAVYTLLGVSTSLAAVVVGAFIAGAGGSFFFPANTKTVMNSSPPEAYGVVSGLSRTFTNVGLVCSLAVALLLASISIPRQLALGIFLGVGGISPQLSAAYVEGMHSALFVFIGIVAFAIVLSLSRGKDVVNPASRARDTPAAPTAPQVVSNLGTGRVRLVAVLFGIMTADVFLQLLLGGLLTFGFLDPHVHILSGFILLFLAIATMIVSIVSKPRVKTLLPISISLVLLIILQAILGFDTLDTGSQMVAWAHFIVAMVIYGTAVSGTFAAFGASRIRARPLAQPPS